MFGIALAFLICVISIAISLILLTRHPEGYTPAQIQQTNEVSPYLTHKLGPEFFNSVQENIAFALDIDQAGINDAVSRDSFVDGGWPISAGALTIYAPTVEFYDGQLVLFGKTEFSAVPVIVKVVADSSLQPDGLMVIHIKEVRAGALDVTNFAKAMAKRMAAPKFSERNELSPTEKMTWGIIHDEPFLPVFKFGEYWYRVEGMTLAKENLVLNFRPEKVLE